MGDHGRHKIMRNAMPPWIEKRTIAYAIEIAGIKKGRGAAAAFSVRRTVFE